jgi:hypothetical protein
MKRGLQRGRFKGKPVKIRRCARNRDADQQVSEVGNLPWSVVRFPGRDQPRSVGPFGTSETTCRVVFNGRFP